MQKFSTLQINDKIINKYLYFKNLYINRKYSSSKKIIKKIDSSPQQCPCNVLNQKNVEMSYLFF